MQRLKQENYSGEIGGKKVGLWTLRNKHGLEAAICNWGARICQVLAPDKDGKFDDVVLGYDTLSDAMAGMPEMGAMIGLMANRIANARFELGGRTYELAANDGPNSLHSGPVGCMNRVFDVIKSDERSVSLEIKLPDGTDGFPGNCVLTVVYSLKDDNGLEIKTEVATDAQTIVNVCNHAYFNLGGEKTPDILGHVLELNAAHYTKSDSALIPTGEIAPVAGTPFDFTPPHAIGERIGNDHEQLRAGRGYDHNFVLNKPEGDDSLSFAVRLLEPGTGRVMEVWTTEPGIQLYTGNFIQSEGMQKKYVGKGGRVMPHRGALCLETQHFPDAVHHSHFPSIVLNAGERYVSTTIYRFLTA
jgi:aldose 1-epimerase